MAFARKEASRDKSSPTRLFLFRGADPAVESLLKSVAILPGATEFGLGTTRVSSESAPLNYYAGSDVSDFVASLDDLQAAAPEVSNITLIVSWFGSDLRAGQCQIRPKVASATTTSSPYEWRVGAQTRANADVVSQYLARPAFSGSPSDRSIFEAIQEVKSRGLRCTIYPTLLMDIPNDNTLPNPGGGNSQPAYPWRGRIVASQDQVALTRTEINSFFGVTQPEHFSWNAASKSVNWTSPVSGVWNYRKFILHMATIAAAADADDFLIGGGLAGLTAARDADGAFPAVDHLFSLAGVCREVLGSDVRISYAAHWTEYHSMRSGNDVIFNMDRFWSSADVDFIGIDNFMPIADWRDGMQHQDWLNGYTSIHDIPYLQSNIEGGEHYEWRYQTPLARTLQSRTNITDAAHNEPWVFRLKDIRNWWANTHHNRIGGTRGAATQWVPRSKPIVFTSIGCAAIDKGANEPDRAVDEKSAEQNRPYFSNGRPDAAIMRAFLEAHIRYWRQNNEPGFIELDSITGYAWDARPFPTFPDRGAAVFPDAMNWRASHHLTGRMQAGRAFESGEFGPFAFTDAEHPITRGGITYQPWPIKHDDISSTNSLDKSELNVTLAVGSGVEDAFIGYPPSQVVNLTIFQGQMDDIPTLADFPAIWLGRINSPKWENNEITFACLPVSSSIRRPGLRRNYQIGCPHVLYGPQCRADRAAASRGALVTATNRNVVTFDGALPGVHENYRGGLAEWTTAEGSREVRTIIATSATTMTLRGSLKGLLPGMVMTIRFGCDHTTGPRGCSLHANWLNYGGQPMIPLDNPLSQKNQFY